MANNKTTVSKKSTANKSNLVNLPKSVREGDNLSQQQKVLLNYFLGQLNSWSKDGVSFYVSYKQIMEETGIASSNTIGDARKRFRALGFLDFDSHNVNGQASDYYFDRETLDKWREERKQEMLTASTLSSKSLREVSKEIETRSQSASHGKVSMKTSK